MPTGWPRPSCAAASASARLTRVKIRPAVAADLALLVDIERDDEGITPGHRAAGDNDEALRRKIEPFVADGGAQIAADGGAAIGAILWRIRELATVEAWSVFREIDASVFPPDGRFAEIFQLWVDPAHRRRGVATALKRALEVAARARGAGLVYTHTEARNAHVLALNARLGYREVRRGPIWDAVVRVSLIKLL
jgi:ribosomal protein S18 acetylase RimI-like enzyme